MMKKILFLVMVLLVFGCSRTTDVPEPTTNESISTQEIDAFSCTISSREYIVMGHFIYHVNNNGDEIVYSPVGTYTKYSGVDRWSLTMYLNKNNSIYADTLKYITEGKLPNNLAVECIDASTVPESFIEFYDNHEELFQNHENTYEIVSEKRGM